MIMVWTGTILEVQTNGMVKRQKNRLTVSILAAMAAAILVAGGFRLPQYPAASAWWGTMYPEFCFSEGSGDSPRKISFWLAEVLEW